MQHCKYDVEVITDINGHRGRTLSTKVFVSSFHGNYATRNLKHGCDVLVLQWI